VEAPRYSPDRLHLITHHHRPCNHLIQRMLCTGGKGNETDSVRRGGSGVLSGMGGLACLVATHIIPGNGHPAPDSLALMTKQDVISMSKAGAGDDVHHRTDQEVGLGRFRCGPGTLFELADSGVSNRVLRTMIQNHRSGSPPARRREGTMRIHPTGMPDTPLLFRGISAIPSGTILPSITPGIFRSTLQELWAARLLRRHGYYGGYRSLGGDRAGAHRAGCDPGEGTADL